MTSWGHVLAAAVALAAVRVYTNALPPHMFASVAYFVGVLALADSLLATPLTQTIISVGSARSTSAGRLLAATYSRHLFSVCATYIFLPILAAGIGMIYWNVDCEVISFLAPVAIACTMMETLKAGIVACLYREAQTHKISLWAFLDAFQTLALIYASLQTVAATPLGYACGHLAAKLTGMLLLLLLLGDLRFFFRPRARLEGVEERRAYRFAYPIVAMGPIGWIGTYLDRYILGSLLGAHEVGLYTAAMSLVSRPYAIATTVLTTYFRPQMTRAVLRSRRRPYTLEKLVLAWIGAACAFSATFLVALHFLKGSAVELLLAQPYRDTAAELLLSAGLAHTLLIVGHALDNNLLALGKSRLLLMQQLVMLPAPVVVLYIAIAQEGLMGALYGRITLELIRITMLTGILLFGGFAKRPRL